MLIVTSFQTLLNGKEIDTQTNIEMWKASSYNDVGQLYGKHEEWTSQARDENLPYSSVDIVLFWIKFVKYLFYKKCLKTFV